MTLDDFRKLKTGDYVKFVGEAYRLTLSGYSNFEFENCNEQSPRQTMSIKYYYTALPTDIFINGVPTNYTKAHIEQISEKEVLEIQLKDAEEQVQKDTARVDSIKAKLEELSKPKLKIGGLYKFKFNGNPNSSLGVLYACSEGLCSGIYYFITPGLNRLTVDLTTPNGNGIDFNAIKKSDFKEITNPKYSHIGKTIMEFIALSQKTFND